MTHDDCVFCGARDLDGVPHQCALEVIDAPTIDLIGFEQFCTSANAPKLSETHRDFARRVWFAALEWGRSHSGSRSAACPPPSPEALVAAWKDAAEMLWVVVANVSGGDWLQQSQEWRTAAAKWRDNYIRLISNESGAAVSAEDKNQSESPEAPR